MTGKKQKTIDLYLENVLMAVTPKTLKEDISKEIQCHLTESIEEGIQFGLSEEQAAESAVKRMGDASELGKQMAEIHRPRLNGWIIGPTITLLVLGWITMYSTGRLSGQLLFGLIGLAFGGTLTFFDYAKLKRFAVPMFVTILGIVGLAIFFGPKYDGQPYIFLGPVRIKVMDACPFLFIVALAGMVTRRKWDAPKEAILVLSASVLVQTLFFFTNSPPSLAMFTIAMTAVMHFSSSKYWQTCLVGLVGVVLMLLFHNSAAYVTPETFSSVQAAESHTDYVVSYLMGSMGKWAGMVAIIAALLLTVQLMEVIRGIKAETPRLVVIGIATLLASEFGWSILANLEWAPMPVVGMNFPLLSFGGTLLIVHLASIGLTLSAYRRRTLRLI